MSEVFLNIKFVGKNNKIEIVLKGNKAAII